MKILFAIFLALVASMGNAAITKDMYLPVDPPVCNTWEDTLLPYATYGLLRQDLFFGKKQNLKGCFPQNEGFFEFVEPIAIPTQEISETAPLIKTASVLDSSTATSVVIEPASELAPFIEDLNSQVFLAIIAGFLIVISLRQEKRSI